VTATPIAERAREQPAASRTSGRSAAAPAGDRSRQLSHVPRPAGDTTVVELTGLTAGGLAAVHAEWAVDGATVLLTDRGPFTELTGRAGVRADGSFDGTVHMRARIRLLGLDLAEAGWQVESWQPHTPLAAPRVTLHGSTLDLDLTGLPPEVSVSVPGGAGSMTRDGPRASIRLPAVGLPEGQPLAPRIVEAYRGLLGVDLDRLRVHPDAPTEAPAFVTDRDLFFAPGRYGADSPGTLRIVDRAIRAALAGAFGPLLEDTALAQPVTPEAPAGGGAAEAAARAAATPVEATRPRTERAETTPAGTGGEKAPEGAAAEASATSEEAAAAPSEGEEAARRAAGTAEEAVPAVKLLMPEPPSELGPQAVARGGTVARGAGSAARGARDLPTAGATVDAAREAVTEPVAETAARAREELAAELGERPPPSPEIVALAERIRTAIRENRPEDEDELLATDPTREARSAGSTITGAVEGQVAEVAGSYDAMATPPPGTPARTSTPLQQQPTTAPGMGVEAADAAPDPIPPEHTSLDADVAATDQRIQTSGIDTRVTQEIPDGPFAEVRAARGELGEVAERTPQEIQAEQHQAIESAQADMAQLQLDAVAAMRQARSGTVRSVAGGQSTMVGSEEQTRESVSRRAQQIYDDAQQQVNRLLQPLSRTAIARWEAGLARLSQDFHNALARVQRWIEERHSGVGGAILAIGDYITGLPGWVTREYNRAEREFGDGVSALLIDVSRDVNGVLAAAQAVIRAARSDIDDAFDAMEAEFPEWAAAERTRFGGMLDGLSERVTQARTSFVDDVSRRAVTAVNEVHATVQARRDEAAGLVGRVVAAIEEFVEDPVRAIINGLLRLVGIPPAAFWAVVARIEQVISDIADDPERFVNNLVAGLREGFQRFFDSFGRHVLQGFWDWLFSGLQTSIPMPPDMSARSLFAFALELMGISWGRIREMLVRHVGSGAVEVAEKAWDLISMLIERGPAGIVEMIREQLAPENIVGTILDAAVEYLTETLIQQVVVRIAGMLNPVGAIAQAIDLIYQVCSWIFRNAARIFRFVEAVVNGLADVVAGNIGGLAGAVERALASLIPPVIDFVAGLLHLGGLPGEVAQVITRLQTVVNAALDRVIGFLAQRARALLARLGIGAEEAPSDGDRDEDTELGTTVRFSAAGESHLLYVDRAGDGPRLMVASTPTTIPGLIESWNAKLDAGEPADETERATARQFIDLLRSTSETADREASRLVGHFERLARDDDPGAERPSDDALEDRERQIASMLTRLFRIFGEPNQARRLQEVQDALPKRGHQHTEEVLRNWRRDYIAVLRAKPVDGREAAVWNADDFAAEGLAPHEVLTSSSNHTGLLGYYEMGKIRKGADTEEFREYAFINTSAPHDVRAKFFGSLGNRVAAKMRTDGSARLTEDSELRTKVRAIRYRPHPFDYGSFEPWPDREISSLVRGVIRLEGALAAFEAFVKGLTVGAVSYEEFRDALLEDQRGRTWVADQLRDIQTGQHEWLPVSIGYEVLHHAVEAGREDLRRGMGWIALLEHLRTPTSGVLWQIVRDPVVERGERSDQGRIIDPQAHVAALSRERYRLVQGGLTVGSGEFHDALRDFFRQNRDMDPAAWVDALLAHLPTIMWTGSNVDIPLELRNRPIGVFYAMPSGFRGDLTVGQVMAEQQRRWEAVVTAFRRAKAGIR
jgi:hypothetical protein